MVMASALLASRTEPCWGGERKVVYTSTNPNPSPNSTPPRHDDRRQNHLQTIEPAALPTASTSAAAASDDSSPRNPKPLYRRRKETGRYVTYNISSYSKEELRELKRKLVSEVELVRRVARRVVESTAASSSVVQPSVKKKKLTAGMMKRCSQILTKLMKHAGAVWFRAPVDVVALKLYDYHQIIRNPMDLGTVRSRLGRGLYPTPADFAADVRLTFNNALVYNPPGHDVHMFAGLLLRQFESSFASAYQRYEKQLAAIYHRAEAEREREEQKLRFASSWSRPPAPPPESQTRVEQAPVAIPSPEQSSVAPPPPPPPLPQKKQQQQQPKAKGKKKKMGRAMSLAEKESLTSAVEELAEEKTEELLQIIRKRNVEMVAEYSSEGEVELDFELMDNETLWELARFVSSSNCKKKKQKKEKQKRRRGGASDASNLNESVAPPLSPMAAEAAAAAAKKSADDEDVDICGDNDDDNLPVVTNYPPMEIEKDTTSSSSGSASSSSSSSSGGSSSGSDAQSPAPRN